MPISKVLKSENSSDKVEKLVKSMVELVKRDSQDNDVIKFVNGVVLENDMGIVKSRDKSQRQIETANKILKWIHSFNFYGRDPMGREAVMSPKLFIKQFLQWINCLEECAGSKCSHLDKKGERLAYYKCLMENCNSVKCASLKPRGDCDDLATIYATFLEAVGIPTIFVMPYYSAHDDHATKEKKEKPVLPNHIAVGVGIPSKNYRDKFEFVIGDPTARGLPLAKKDFYEEKVGKIVRVIGKKVKGFYIDAVHPRNIDRFNRVIGVWMQ